MLNPRGQVNSYVTFFFVCLYSLQKIIYLFLFPFHFVFFLYVFPFYSNSTTSICFNFFYSLSPSCVSQTSHLVSRPHQSFHQHLGYFIWSTSSLFRRFKLLLCYYGRPQPHIHYTPRISTTTTNSIQQSWQNVTTLIDLLSIQTYGIPQQQTSLWIVETDKCRMVHASNHCNSCTKINQHLISNHATFPTHDVTTFHHTHSSLSTKNDVATPTQTSFD